MADGLDSFIAKMVEGPARVRPEYDQHDGDKRHPNRRPKRPPRESKDYLGTLQKAAEASNTVLQKRHSPYRFCVYSKRGDVFVELVILDENGRVKEERTRRITHESFEQWIEDLSAIEGLYLDERA